VERHLGFGGTSTVALAEDPQGRKVALKVIRPELAQRLGERFGSEPELLDRLRHPGIARLLDAGVLANGLPFVATEYVEGVSLDEALAGKGWRQILEVLLEVCDAVHHAHRNLVIHRDLKPANILVGEDLRPKLLDFGLARLLEPHPAREPTATAQLMLTPSCASPEQLRGEVLTTATDIYSLGVLLYSLLTGRHPQEPWRGSPTAFTRAIQEEDPVRPSHYARQREGAGLERDLDAVVAKALHKDPAQRYGSVEAFQEDLRRLLGGKPVTAQRDTFAYRTARFLRRHRRAALAAAAAALLVLCASAILWRQQHKTLQAQDRARQSMEILVDLLATTDPGRSGGEPITARGLLDLVTQRLEDYQQDQPAVRALLLDAVGKLYLGIHALGEAEVLLDEALEIQRSGADLGPEPTAKLLRHQGELEDLKGDFSAAESFYREAVSWEKRASGKATQGLASSLNGLGDSLHGQGRYDEARPFYEEALKLRRELHGNEHPEVAETLNHLGILEHEQRRVDRAEPLYRESLDLRRRLLGSKAPEVAESLHNLASLLREIGQMEEAEELLREAMALELQLFGEESPQRVGGLERLAAYMLESGRMGEAKELFLTIDEILIRGELEESPDRGTNFYHLGLIAWKEGDGEAAETYHRKALELYGKSLPKDHLWASYPSMGLGRVLLETGRAAEAVGILRQAVAVRRKVFMAEPWRLAEADIPLVAALIRTGELREARSLLEPALLLLEQELREDDERVLEAKAALRNLEQAEG